MKKMIFGSVQSLMGVMFLVTTVLAASLHLETIFLLDRICSSIMASPLLTVLCILGLCLLGQGQYILYKAMKEADKT